MKWGVCESVTRIEPSAYAFPLWTPSTPLELGSMPGSVLGMGNQDCDREATGREYKAAQGNR